MSLNLLNMGYRLLNFYSIVNLVDVINQVKVGDNSNGFYIFEIILGSILCLSSEV